MSSLPITAFLPPSGKGFPRMLDLELSPLPREAAGAVFVLNLEVAVELILRRDELAGGNLIETTS